MGAGAGTRSTPRAGCVPVRVRIDEAACEGHGRCFAIAPALFELDELGTSSLIGDGSVSPDAELVRLAAANCPEFAIGISGD